MATRASATVKSTTLSPSSREAERRLEGFIDQFTPAIAADARAALAKLRKLIPNALELVYDNYAALVVGLCPNERALDSVFSLVIYPRHLTLCFIQGAGLPDPDGILKGDGNVVRHLRIETQTTLDEPAVRRAMLLALDLARAPFDPAAKRRVEIRRAAEKRLPRRPEPKAAPKKRNGDRR